MRERTSVGGRVGCMSLEVYRDKNMIPKELASVFVEANDRFFSAYGSIEDTQEVRKILKDIEHAEYCNRIS